MAALYFVTEAILEGTLIIKLPAIGFCGQRAVP
jgi:hypothetical protein